MPRTAETCKPSTEDVYVPTPADACDEAASRLLVVQRILLDHINHCVPRSPDSDHEDDDGYDISIAVDAIERIRTQLTTSAKGGV